MKDIRETEKSHDGIHVREILLKIEKEDHSIRETADATQVGMCINAARGLCKRSKEGKE